MDVSGIAIVPHEVMTPGVAVVVVVAVRVGQVCVSQVTVSNRL
jgi:hypothetical protein